MAMERPPKALLRPWILGRVLRPRNPLARVLVGSTVESDERATVP